VVLSDAQRICGKGLLLYVSECNGSVNGCIVNVSLWHRLSFFFFLLEVFFSVTSFRDVPISLHVCLVCVRVERTFSLRYFLSRGVLNFFPSCLFHVTLLSPVESVSTQEGGDEAL